MLDGLKSSLGDAIKKIVNLYNIKKINLIDFIKIKKISNLIS